MIGTIADYGTRAASDENGKFDPNGYIKVILHKGTFQIKTSLDDAKTFSDRPLARPSSPGVRRALSSTGRACIPGSKATCDSVRPTPCSLPLKFRPSGGQCKVGGSNKPIAEYNTLSATGNVSFG